MCLSGQGGSGKSTTIFACNEFCLRFSQLLSIPFDDMTMCMTAYTGSAACLIKGVTLHSATGMCKTTSRVTDEERNKWKHNRSLVIDEYSFVSLGDLEKLDKMFETKEARVF